MVYTSNVRGKISWSSSKAVSHLLQKPWFSRIWVVQEIARCRAATAICGSKPYSGTVSIDGRSVTRLS
ncbi:hypothetical protein K469DRAFT_776275 [Zopfia rhizophila CBS 207.26]|uniref:Heterokaryon incompatibility domain-containing protein n=1 Tax=Zopfia rhizophila CBS 207.26 TaxID=1314779 RepID=A0A6A6E8U6_9PEZI|nr:hypothetical protein K469DRAFT_776275 [Zopfia rhizophila CBS 207.26]